MSEQDRQHEEQAEQMLRQGEQMAGQAGHMVEQGDQMTSQADKIGAIVGSFTTLSRELRERNALIRKGLKLLGVLIGIAVIVAAFGIGQFIETRRISHDSHKTGLRTERQALVNDRDILNLKVRFEENADCGPQYLKDLLEASAAREPITEVQLPEKCEVSADIEALKQRALERQAEIDAFDRRHPSLKETP